MTTDFRATLLALLAEHMEKAGVTAAELGDDYDLVQSGLLDSFEFLNLIGEIEDATGRAIDLSCAADDLTTPGGLARLAAASA